MKATNRHHSDDRLLSFEVDGTAFALPIESVLEVAEVDRVTCVPGVTGDIAGVMNWHGDPLPLVASRRLLAASRGEADEGGEASETSLLREQVLVISDRADESARLGMPVDRVLGLIVGGQRPGRAQGVVVERRPVDGRVVAVLDPQGLVARAEEIIECAVEEAAA
jgi:chemotaxis signal transduction protein